MSKPGLPHLLLPAPRLSCVLARHLARRFAGAPIDGHPPGHWSAPAGGLPALMALAAGERVEWMAAERWRAYAEPSPVDLPCGAWLASDPDPQRWVWALGRLFDQPRGLSGRAQAAWHGLLLRHLPRLDWDIVETVQAPARA